MWFKWSNLISWYPAELLTTIGRMFAVGRHPFPRTMYLNQTMNITDRYLSLGSQANVCITDNGRSKQLPSPPTTRQPIISLWDQLITVQPVLSHSLSHNILNWQIWSILKWGQPINSWPIMLNDTFLLTLNFKTVIYNFLYVMWIAILLKLIM